MLCDMSASNPGATTGPRNRAWSRLRARWVWHLVNVGPVICGAPDCSALITADDRWHLGHPAGQPRVLGGNDADATPWCVACNLADGARVGHQQRAARAASARTTTPSRDW
jgi:hypothetical protein